MGGGARSSVTDESRSAEQVLRRLRREERGRLPVFLPELYQLVIDAGVPPHQVDPDLYPPMLLEPDGSLMPGGWAERERRNDQLRHDVAARRVAVDEVHRSGAVVRVSTVFLATELWATLGGWESYVSCAGQELYTVRYHSLEAARTGHRVILRGLREAQRARVEHARQRGRWLAAASHRARPGAWMRKRGRR